jgi:hypothetical protein
MGGVEVVGQSGVVLNRGNPKDGGTCPPGGDPHGGGDGACPPGGAASSPDPSVERRASKLTWIRL